MTLLSGMIIFITGLIVGAIFIWVIRQREMDSIQQSRDQMEAIFGNLSKEALDQNIQTFLKLTESRFAELLKSSDTQLDEKKKLINVSIKEIKSSLESLKKETSELRGHMAESRQGITRLTDTTSQLRQILSSSQARGQWGERMVEDILNFIGLTEGINYLKQTTEGVNRPDYTFLLPQQKRINMDVKFPLAHYERYLAADSDELKAGEKKQFLRDVRNHVKALAKRDYIDPAGGTVNYVLMFIPNESIYAFLNQEDLELIDFSLSKKIILCSPITLYAVLSLIRQAVDNFAMEVKAGEMQRLVQAFKKQWEMFKDKVEALGKSLNTAQKHYDELSSTRSSQLQKPMDKIVNLQLEQAEEQKYLEETDE